MDFASLIGIIAGTMMVIGAMLAGGSLGDYINGPGLLIVIGGTVSATLLNFRFKAVLRAYRSVGHVFSSERENPIVTLTEIMKINNIAKKKGPMELDRYIKETGHKTGNRIIKKAAMLSIDNLTEEDTVISLRAEIDNIKIQNTINQEVFKKMASYAPAMGMIGTLIGLVQMLGKMTDPAQLGPAMGLALLTTFYGAFFATMIFLPIAGKLRVVMLESITNLEIIYEGALALATGRSMMSLYERAISYIPAGQRISYEELKKRYED